MAKRKIVMAGGGTGGHIFPAVAIAQRLQQEDPDLEILFIGARGKMEMERVPQAGFRIEGLDIAGFNRSSLIKNIGLPFKLVRSWMQVRRIFRDFQPDAAVGVGGYSSFPVLKYAQQRGIPTFIHESNSFAGKANIMLGRAAARIYVAVDGMEKFFPADRIRVTGNPVRKSISTASLGREEAIRHFGLDPSRPVVLSVGGSLGAQSINEAIEEGLHRMLAEGLQLIWQTGKRYQSKNSSPEKGSAHLQSVWAAPFISEMEKAYAAADIIVSRAGAMAISEITVMGKPAIFVPYPFAAEDHQGANARKMVEKKAGWLISDRDAREHLVTAVLALSAAPEEQAEIRKNAAALAIRDADTVVAKDILKTLEERNRLS